MKDPSSFRLDLFQAPRLDGCCAERTCEVLAPSLVLLVTKVVVLSTRGVTTLSV